MRWEDDLILDSTSEELRSRVLQRVAERAPFAGWLPSMSCRNLSHFLSMHAPRHGTTTHVFHTSTTSAYEYFTHALQFMHSFLFLLSLVFIVYKLSTSIYEYTRTLLYSVIPSLILYSTRMYYLLMYEYVY